MMIVSIYETDEKFIIELKHKTEYVVEKKFWRTKTSDKRTFNVFSQLFLSVTKLLYKELFAGYR